ncbi:MAG TPA: hypothetical protein VGV59_03730 [Pyrinomonadaceae bacterium]|nr:hypothetical protein [Pyrinomonadaceae bacterium]
MSSKNTKAKSKKAPGASRRSNGHKISEGLLPLIPAKVYEGQDALPRHLNPETPEEREKRLAKRKAATLRAFQTTYENHHRQRSS